MSWNNILPAKILLDIAQQETLSKNEYLKWLDEQIEETGDEYYKRRYVVVAQGEITHAS